MPATVDLCLILSIFVALFRFGHPQSLDFQVVCQRTTFTSLCNEIIDASGSANLKKTPTGVLTILSDKAKSYIITTQTQIGDLLRGNPSSRLKYSLQTCSDQYTNAQSALKMLFWSELSSTNYPDYVEALGKVLDGVNACKNAFIGYPPIPTPSPINVYIVDAKMAIELTLQVLHLNICNRITACKLQ